MVLRKAVLVSIQFVKFVVADCSFRLPSFLCREIMFGELDRSFVNVSNLWLVSLVLIISISRDDTEESYFVEGL